MARGFSSHTLRQMVFPPSDSATFSHASIIGRVKTTPDFIPSGSLPKQQTLAEFKRLQLELVGMVNESDGLAIDKVSIT